MQSIHWARGRLGRWTTTIITSMYITVWDNLRKRRGFSGQGGPLGADALEFLFSSSAVNLWLNDTNTYPDCAVVISHCEFVFYERNFSQNIWTPSNLKTVLFTAYDASETWNPLDFGRNSFEQVRHEGQFMRRTTG